MKMEIYILSNLLYLPVKYKSAGNNIQKIHHIQCHKVFRINVAET